MAKEDIFSKINLKDYNNILENVLEQKAFSEDVKNLLLSMLYKIENGYEDYKTIKVNVSSKKNYVKKIIEVIKEECKEIKLVKPLSDESKVLEEKNVNYIVEKEKGKITVYPNERMMLEALIELSQKEIELEDEYYLYSLAMKNVLSIGNKMNYVEVIRDFNGWSWDITTSQMESKNINIVYQNLLILLGNHFLQTWIINNEEDEEEVEMPNNEILRSKYNENFGMTTEEMQEEKDYVNKMQEILIEKYGKENAQNFWNQLIKTILAIGININKEQKKILLEEKKKVEEHLEKMQDNKKYVEELSKTKKDLTKKIKEIDTILSDEKLLKEEYEKRNSKLANKDKIFSVSHLNIMLEKEREKYLNQIKECNLQMQPKEFVVTKQKLESQKEFYEEIDIKESEKTNEEKQIEELQKYFLKCLEEKIDKAEGKKEITDLIYEIRYYEQLPYKQYNISKESKIEEYVTKVEKQIIKKACVEKVLIRFTQEEELNYKILKNQFQSKIIKLENTIYVLKYKKGILKIEIYDTNIEEETKEIEISEKVELNVKLNKKIKIWEWRVGTFLFASQCSKKLEKLRKIKKMEQNGVCKAKRKVPFASQVGGKEWKLLF